MENFNDQFPSWEKEYKTLQKEKVKEKILNNCK